MSWRGWKELFDQSCQYFYDFWLKEQFGEERMSHLITKKPADIFVSLPRLHDRFREPTRIWPGQTKEKRNKNVLLTYSMPEKSGIIHIWWDPAQTPVPGYGMLQKIKPNESRLMIENSTENVPMEKNIKKISPVRLDSYIRPFKKLYQCVSILT